jgi:penicillin-binding protein 1A
MARAYAVFANQGRDVTPIAIRTIEDRNGRVVFDVEREVRQRQRRMGNSIQVVSPQNAYIMTKIMEKTVDEGSLSIGAGWGSKFSFRDENGSYKLPVAGKTGTTQNWSDAWAIGFSPYYTTAVWFGFDRPGNSLGVELTGATLAGPVWGDFFREIHRGLPRKSFSRPTSGIIDVAVCAKSGFLRTGACNQGEVTLPFLEGTQPNQYCDIHVGSSPYQTRMPVSIPQFGGFDSAEFLNSLPMPQLPLDLLPELRNNTQNRTTTTTNRNTRNTNTSSANTRNQPAISFSNPFLDDDLPVSNTPAGNPAATENTPNEPFVFPDTVIQFVPREDDDTAGDDEDLPSWNPVR